MATTEQLMAQYGVAWFGFDELSGNYIDKLGNGSSATPTNITRTMGWNGEGLAASTTKGAVNLNKRFEIGSKTFRFKVKYKVLGGALMVNYADNTTNGNGLSLTIGSTGAIGFTYYMTSFGVDTVTIVTKQDVIKVNRWHEIMLTLDNVKDGFIKVYVDGKLEGKVIQHKSQDRVESGLTYFMRSSFMTEQYAGYSNCEIDDLQIYNKALSPSDFTQKRLAVKTTDNKNFVLSPTSTRVKEIPNTAEYMMLAQGGVVKEIDSAVDRPPIDFTKTTTEYEIVNNNRTPLGKGRVFTIPIGSDFKTAMIEDNY